MRGAAWLLLALVLAGCTSSPAPPTNNTSTPPAPQALVAAAPWWDLGDVYTVSLQRAGQPATTWRMGNFWNDTGTEHFWLGVSDRRQAMDMALFDTNPFLGRIHHHILTPHERGMHAAMYSFPLEDGKRWNGFFFDHNWTFEATAASIPTPIGTDRGFRIEGTSTQGDARRIAYDYSPAIKWFVHLTEFDSAGSILLSAEVIDYERAASGNFVFLRGVDFYKGPTLRGAHDAKFDVNDDVSGLAFYVRARATGPLEIQLLDPSGQLRERIAAATGGEANYFEEIAPVPRGQWTVRYVATGGIDGTVLATGLQETKRAV